MYYARVKSFNGNISPIVVGKLYRIISHDFDSDNYIKGFHTIICGDSTSFCLVKDCAFLNGGDWEIIDTESKEMHSHEISCLSRENLEAIAIETLKSNKDFFYKALHKIQTNGPSQLTTLIKR